MSNFDVSYELLLGHEGRFTKDRRDRGNWTGGRVGKGKLKGTKYGVSAMSYPHLDIENLSLDQSKEIYRRDYWNASRCYDLPLGVSHVVFDCAVNHGPSTAIKLLQKAVGAAVDGKLGPRTIKRVTSKPSKDTIVEMCARRGLFYADIKTVNVYGLGWYRRQCKVLREAFEIIDSDTTRSPAASEPVPTHDPTPPQKPTILGGLFKRYRS